jgi:hypothetical protein
MTARAYVSTCMSLITTELMIVIISPVKSKFLTNESLIVIFKLIHSNFVKFSGTKNCALNYTVLKNPNIYSAHMLMWLV